MYLPWHIYEEAEADGVDVHFLKLETQGSLSVSDNIVVDASKLPTTAEETTAAIHELGHCNTGSFYNVYSPIDNRRKNENNADRYAIKRYINKEELLTMLEQGEQPYEIAMYYGLTEAFIRKAICYYVNGNLAVEAYSV